MDGLRAAERSCCGAWRTGGLRFLQPAVRQVSEGRLGNRLKEARQTASLTQPEMAERVSVSCRTINTIENGCSSHHLCVR